MKIVSISRGQSKRHTQKELFKALNKPITLVVGDEQYESSKEFYKNCKHVTIMSASEAFKEQEIISDYYYGPGILIEPKMFDPRASFEHIRKKK